jgi:hypothetical protein
MRIVHSLDELRQLPRDRLVNGFRVRSEVQLEIPRVTWHTQVRAQAALNRLQESRGALAGSLMMMAALLYGVVDIMRRHESLLSLRAASELLAVLGLAFSLGFAARFISCAIKRWQFTRRCRELSRLLAVEADG